MPEPPRFLLPGRPQHVIRGKAIDIRYSAATATTRPTRHGLLQGVRQRHCVIHTHMPMTDPVYLLRIPARAGRNVTKRA